MLDNTAINYIYNDIKLFHDFRSSTALNRLESGTQSLEIQGYKTAYISIQTLNSPQKFRFNNIAYILEYITNLVCFRRFNQIGI